MPSRSEVFVTPIMTLGYTTQPEDQAKSYGTQTVSTTLILLSAEAIPGAVKTPRRNFDFGCPSPTPSPIQSETPSEVDAALKTKGLEPLTRSEPSTTPTENRKSEGAILVEFILEIVVGYLGGALSLGLLESYFWHFQFLVRGKSALRGGTVIWMICTAGLGYFFAKKEKAVKSEVERQAMREWIKERGAREKLALWWKWAFTWKYPDVLAEVRREAREKEALSQQVELRMFERWRGDSEGNLDLRLVMEQVPPQEPPPAYKS